MRRTSNQPRRLSEIQSLTIVIAALVVVLASAILHLVPEPAGTLVFAGDPLGAATGSIR